MRRARERGGRGAGESGAGRAGNVCVTGSLLQGGRVSLALDIEGRLRTEGRENGVSG